MTRWLLGVLLLAHGLVHLGLAPRADRALREHDSLLAVRRSWLLSRHLRPATVRDTASALLLGAITGFVVAGVGLIGQYGWWRPTAVVAAITSLVLLLLYWRADLAVGAALSATVLATVLWGLWPSTSPAGT